MRILHLSLQRPTFIQKMMYDKKQFAVVVLIVVHICTSLLMPYSHKHVFYGSSDGQQSIQNHTCGANEIHPPLDDCHHCLLCLRVSTSNANLELSSAVPEACVQPIVDPEIIRIVAMGMHFSEPDRGPPSFSA